MAGQAGSGGGKKAGGAAGGDAPQSPLQNPKVQIGIIAGGVVAILVVVFVMFIMPMMSGPQTVSGTTTPPPMPGTGTGFDSGSGQAPSMPGTAPAGPGVPGGGGLMPATPSAGGVPAPGGADQGNAPQGPGVPVRRNPFEPNRDLRATLASIPKPPTAPEALPPTLEVYRELYVPEPPVSDEEQPGPAIPPMRVAGVVTGNIVTATLQIGNGDQFFQVRPGDMVPPSNPVYRIESIGTDKVVITRRWELNGKSGTQRIEVPLVGGSGSAAGSGGFNPGAGGGLAPAGPGAQGRPGALF